MPNLTPNPDPTKIDQSQMITPTAPSASFVKLAMRNMVRQGGKSLVHFSLTTAGLLGVLVGLAYLTR